MAVLEKIVSFVKFPVSWLPCEYRQKCLERAKKKPIFFGAIEENYFGSCRRKDKPNCPYLSRAYASQGRS